MYSNNNDNNNNNNNNQKCQKFPGKTFLRDFNKQFLKINLLLWKKAALHTNSLMHYNARHVLCSLLSTNQENSSEMTFVTETTKINHKKLKI